MPVGRGFSIVATEWLNHLGLKSAIPPELKKIVLLEHTVISIVSLAKP